MITRLSLNQTRPLPPEPLVLKNLPGYQRSIRAAARGLWAGQIDAIDFLSMINSTIDRGLRQAWAEGAASCGIQPAERTQAEIQALNEQLAINKQHTFGFAEWIDANSKAEGGKLGTVFNRVGIWVNRYNQVAELAKNMACADQKLIWLLGEAEHCSTCLKLAGRVMRASRWAELDVVPQDTRPGKLACRGYQCKCRREATDARATPGPLPRLP